MKKKISFVASKLFLTGAVLGLSSLIRPVGPFVLVLVFLLLLCSSFSWWQKIKGLLVVSTGWMLLVIGLLFSNYKATGHIFFHTLTGVHFLTNSTSSVVKQLEGCSLFEAEKITDDEWKNNIHQKEVEIGRPLDEYEQCGIAEQITVKYFKKDPLLMMGHFMMNIVKTILGLHASYFLFVDASGVGEHSSAFGLWERVKPYLFPRVNSWFLIPLTYYEIAYLLLMLVGVFFFVMISFFDSILLATSINLFMFSGLFIALSIGGGCARIRLPAEPLMIIVASYFWVYWIRSLRYESS